MELLVYMGLSSVVVGIYGLISGEILLGTGFVAAGVTLFSMFRKKKGGSG